MPADLRSIARRVAGPALAAAVALAGGAGAARAEDAAATLRSAIAALQAAEGRTARVDALGRLVDVQEGTLADLRDRLRRAELRRRDAALRLDAAEADLARVLAGLAATERASGPLALLHPAGPLGTARAAMLLADAAPVLEARVARLRSEMAALRARTDTSSAAAAGLQAAVARLEAARTAVAAGRGAGGTADLSRGQADALAQAVAALADLPANGAAGGGARGWPWPLARGDGAVLRRGFGAADAAGIVRPGWIIAAPTPVRVTAPVAATVRHAGPLLDYGNVILLEPGPDVVIVLAGLTESYVEEGDVVAEGTPVGAIGTPLGGAAPRIGTPPRQADAGGGASGAETLYLELREAGRPVNPATRFAEG